MSFPVLGSAPIWPEQYTMSPTTRPWFKTEIGDGALSVRMTFLVTGILLVGMILSTEIEADGGRIEQIVIVLLILQELNG